MAEPTFQLIEALRERDKLVEGLEVEIEKRREWAAEQRDLSTRCDTIEDGEELEAKAAGRDEDTDRLQKVLDEARSVPTNGS